jgi:hypothetical protein
VIHPERAEFLLTRPPSTSWQLDGVPVRSLERARWRRLAKAGESRIYFAQVGTAGPIKVGVAGNIAHRLNSLQTANPETIYLLTSVRAANAVAYRHEAEIHATFEPFRLVGEWFRPVSVLLDFVEGLDFGDDIPNALEEARLVLANRLQEAG